MTLETRVGLAALSYMRGILKQYIVAHTEKGLYIGRLDYLDHYVKLNKLLEENNGDNTKSSK